MFQELCTWLKANQEMISHLSRANVCFSYLSLPSRAKWSWSKGALGHWKNKKQEFAQNVITALFYLNAKHHTLCSILCDMCVYLCAITLHKWKQCFSVRAFNQQIHLNRLWPCDHHHIWNNTNKWLMPLCVSAMAVMAMDSNVLPWRG